MKISILWNTREYKRNFPISGWKSIPKYTPENVEHKAEWFQLFVTNIHVMLTNKLGLPFFLFPGMAIDIAGVAQNFAGCWVDAWRSVLLKVIQFLVESLQANLYSAQPRIKQPCSK